MAERRMFAKTIIDSDAFLDMPLSTQALYFHLNMRADDEGFINSPKKIQRMIGASDDDLRILFTKRFVIPFESGVVVIKHWKIHNYIRGDRLVETVYRDEKAKLETKENGVYKLIEECQSDVSQLPDKCQHRLGKDSIGKDSIDMYGQTQFDRMALDFYSSYPRKVKKQDVVKWFNKQKPTCELFSLIMNKLEQFRVSPDWLKDGGKFIPYPTTWLNQKRWEDESICFGKDKPTNVYVNPQQKEFEDLDKFYAN